MNNKLVSIILTLYKINKDYLEECINSLLNQTYENIEILCMDDCSPDFDYAYLQEKSSRIRYYRNEINLGMNRTVNKAFGLAKGDYVVRLGSDDFFDPTLIEKEVSFLDDNSEYGAVCCELQRFGRRERYIRRPEKWDYQDIVVNHRYNGTGYAGGMMFRRELLNFCSIDESLKMCEDFDFHLQILKYMPIASIHECLYYYRAHDTNLCNSVESSERLALLEKIIGKHSSNAMKKCFVFAHSDKNNKIEKYIIDEICLLNKIGDVLFISDCDSLSNLRDLPKIKYIQISKHSLCYVNSYSNGFNYLKFSNQLKNYDNITFLNNSILFPVCDPNEFLEAIDEKDKSNEKVYGMCKSGGILQNYWITCKRTAYNILDEFFTNYIPAETEIVYKWWNKNNSSNALINKYRVWFNLKLKDFGEEYALKWLYTVITFEEGFSAFLEHHGVFLDALTNGIWKRSKYITKVQRDLF